MTKLYPSLLSVDFLDLQHELKRLEEAGVDGVHFDVMDGQFVPNISIGLPILDAVRKGTTLPIDVHLMIENPEKYICIICRTWCRYDFNSCRINASYSSCYSND